MTEASLRGSPAASLEAARARQVACSWRPALISRNSFGGAYARRNCFLNSSGVQSQDWPTVIGGGPSGIGSTRRNPRQFLLVKAAGEKFSRQIIGPKLKRRSKNQWRFSIWNSARLTRCLAVSIQSQPQRGPWYCGSL